MMKGIENELDEESDEMAAEGNEVYKCKEIIHDNLISSGQLDLLKRFMQNRLAQSGWTQNLRKECIEYIKRRGVENVNVSHMVEDIHSVGRARFPEDLRKELFTFLLDFAKTYVDVDESAPPLSEADAAYSGTGCPFHYQSRDAIPDPGLGVGVSTSANNSTNSSCSSQSISDDDENECSPHSRSLAKKSSDLPLLHPENVELSDLNRRSGSEDDDDDVEGEIEEEEDEDLQSDDDAGGFDNEGYEAEKYEDIEGYIVENQAGRDGFLGESEIALKGSRGRNDREEEDDGSSSKSNNGNEEDEEEELMDV